MLEYDRIDVSEGIDINKANASKECKIYHYWYFKDIGFKYEPYLCNGWHGLMGKAITIFLDNTKFKIVWIKITTFFKRHVSVIPCFFSS